MSVDYSDLVVSVRQLVGKHGARIDRVHVASTGTLYLDVVACGRVVGQVRLSDHRPSPANLLRLSMFSVCVQRVRRLAELPRWLCHRITAEIDRRKGEHAAFDARSERRRS